MKTDFEGLKNCGDEEKEKAIKTKNNYFTISRGGLGFDKQGPIIWSLFGIGKKRRFDEPGK
jgi:hypothetical protein